MPLVFQNPNEELEKTVIAQIKRDLARVEAHGDKDIIRAYCRKTAQMYVLPEEARKLLYDALKRLKPDHATPGAGAGGDGDQAG